MMKDLFSGSLGKLNNHGGSRIYTTPHTILVPPEYEVDIGTHGDFVSCSLDGRLWLFKDSLVILRWDSENNKLVFVQSISITETTFLARGIDWILTNRYIIFVKDEAPYYFYYQFSEPLTLSGYKDGIYCLLPKTANNYQLIDQYLFSREENKYYRIDYSFYYGDDYEYDVSFNNITLALFRNQLIGCYNLWFAKCFLIPTTLDVNNETIKFSLFFILFKDDYNSDLIMQDTNIYSFLPSESLTPEKYVIVDNRYSSTTCKNVKGNYIIFLNENNDYTVYDNNGKLYLDIFTNKMILIDKNFLSFRNNNKNKANGLSQWINPTDDKKFEGITENAIISKINDDILVTYPNEMYHRELLRNKQIPLTPYVYDGYRLSLGIKGKKISVNRLPSSEKNLELNLKEVKLITFEITDYNLEDYYGVNVTYDYIPPGRIEIVFVGFGVSWDENGNVLYAEEIPFMYVYDDRTIPSGKKYLRFGNPPYWSDTWWTGHEDSRFEETSGKYIINIKYYDKNDKKYVIKHVIYNIITNYQEEYEESYGLNKKWYPQTKQGTVKISEIADDIHFTVPDYIDTNSVTLNSQDLFIQAGEYNIWKNSQRYFYFYYRRQDFIYCVPQEQCTSANITDIFPIYENDNSNLFIFYFSDGSDMAIRAIFHKELIDNVQI